MDCWPSGWSGLTDNENGGKMLHFWLGRLTSYDYITEPFAFHGKIFDFWIDLSGLTSGLGHPMADPQFPPDGSMCNIFEGGHIHQGGMMGILRQPACGGRSCLNLCFFSVPASKCLSGDQLTMPEYVTMATTHWVHDPSFFLHQSVLTCKAIQPQLFQDKWTFLVY